MYFRSRMRPLNRVLQIPRNLPAATLLLAFPPRPRLAPHTSCSRFKLAVPATPPTRRHITIGNSPLGKGFKILLSRRAAFLLLPLVKGVSCRGRSRLGFRHRGVTLSWLHVGLSNAIVWQRCQRGSRKCKPPQVLEQRDRVRSPHAHRPTRRPRQRRKFLLRSHRGSLLSDASSRDMVQ